MSCRDIEESCNSVGFNQVLPSSNCYMKNSENTFPEELLVKGETPTRSAIQNSNKMQNKKLLAL